MIYKRFVTEGFDEAGVLNRLDFHPPEHFNFAYDVVDALAAEEPNRRALLWTDKNGAEITFSFADIARAADKTANLLKAAGVQKGDRVMLVLKRHYQFWFAMMGLSKVGAVAVPATNLLTKKDFVYRFNAAGISAVIATAEGEVAAHIDAAAPESPTLRVKMTVRGKREGWLDFDELFETAPDRFPRPQGEEFAGDTDPMLMYFTSGTTGEPKMAWHNHLYPLGHIITARYWHNVQPDGLHFTVAETGWGKAVWGKLYGQWLCNAGVFVYDFDKFKPTDLLERIEKYKITTFCAPPTIYRFMIHEDMAAYNLSSLTYATTAGEALNPEVFHVFKRITGLSIMEGFGQTETTLTVVTMVGMTPKPGAMGRPSPAFDVAVVDEEGRPAKAGEVGEIVVRLKHGRPIGLFGGYYRDEEKTAAAHAGGVYHTGDTAWQDEDGYLWYVGRTDDLIKSSGYRIGPFEIESVLMEHPAVMECAITGAPDPVRGQVVKATVVLAPGFTPSEELKKELQTHVKKMTAPYKYPRIVDFVDALPKTISGKIKRTELR